MDLQKEQSIKVKIEAIKTEINETHEVRIRKLKSLINQMNLHLLENQNDKKSILTLQKLGYEVILHLLDNDKETDEVQKQKMTNLITIVESEIKSLI